MHPTVGDREVALRPYSEVLWNRHTLRVQHAVNASPHIILLNSNLKHSNWISPVTTPMRDEALNGAETILCTMAALRRGR